MYEKAAFCLPEIYNGQVHLVYFGDQWAWMLQLADSSHERINALKHATDSGRDIHQH